MKRTVTIEIQAEIEPFETAKGNVFVVVEMDPPVSSEHPACPAVALGSYLETRLNLLRETCRNPIPFGMGKVLFPVAMSADAVLAASKKDHIIDVLAAVADAPGEGFIPDQCFVRSAAQYLETCWRCVAPALHERILRDWLKMVGVEVTA